MTIHMGSGKARLDPLFYAIDNSDVPVQKFLPTIWDAPGSCLNRDWNLLKRGGTIDMTGRAYKGGVRRDGGPDSELP